MEQHSTDVYTLETHLDDATDRLEWATELILSTVKATEGRLEPLTLFAGLRESSARLMTRALNSLIDRNILSTYFLVEDGAVKSFIGFDVSDKAPSR